MAVSLGAALGAVVLTGAGCGGTLEGRYRRGQIGPGGSTTTRPQGRIPAGGAAGSVPGSPVEEPAP
jgi:hypothetical protein